jgi:hypothetical protein
MQRAMSRLANESQQKLGLKDAELAQLRENQARLSEGFDYMSRVVMTALPEDERSRVLGDLQERRLQRMEQENLNLRRVVTTPPPPVQQASPDFEEEMRVILQEARESLEETARELGVDPSAPGLDYGEETETFAKRLKKLNASAKKIRTENEQKDLDSVRARTSTPVTRTTGGSAPDSYVGDDLLKSSSEEIWKRIQQEQRTARSRVR